MVRAACHFCEEWTICSLYPFPGAENRDTWPVCAACTHQMASPEAVDFLHRALANPAFRGLLRRRPAS